MSLHRVGVESSSTESSKFFVRLLVSQKFPHVPLGVGGWPLGHEEKGVGLIVRAISFQDFQPM